MKIALKKTIIALLLVLTAVSSSYAENFLEYKRVKLCAISRTVLVNRFTGEVKYMWNPNRKQWVLLEGVEQKQAQSMYEAQILLKLKCPKNG